MAGFKYRKVRLSQDRLMTASYFFTEKAEGFIKPCFQAANYYRYDQQFMLI